MNRITFPILMSGLLLAPVLCLAAPLVPETAEPNDPNDSATEHLNRGNDWFAKQEYDKALADYNQALAINPRYAPAYCFRGAAWNNQEQYDKALADYNQAIAIDSQYATAFHKRGVVWEKMGEFEKAITDYQQAIKLDPKFAVACNHLAWLYATCPDEKHRDGKKAVEYANKALQLRGGKLGASLGTLAAAYAECGDFAKAKQWQAKAIAWAPSDKSATDKDRQGAASRLELYKQGKPCEGTRQICNSISMKLVLVPAGEFMMGSRESAEDTATVFSKTNEAVLLK